MAPAQSLRTYDFYLSFLSVVQLDYNCSVKVGKFLLVGLNRKNSI